MSTIRHKKHALDVLKNASDADMMRANGLLAKLRKVVQDNVNFNAKHGVSPDVLFTNSTGYYAGAAVMAKELGDEITCALILSVKMVAETEDPGALLREAKLIRQDGEVKLAVQAQSGLLGAIMSMIGRHLTHELGEAEPPAPPEFEDPEVETEPGLTLEELLAKAAGSTPPKDTMH